MKIKHFYLNRKEDVHGKSGVGVVAIGAVFPSGHCILEWLTFTSSINIYKNIDDVLEIHGHEGKTEVIMGDPDDKKRSKRKSSKDPK